MAPKAGRCLAGGVTRRVDADFLVVGAGATGMAFADALVDHGDATVALVDRRHSVGGHWLRAYPFVRLHQASSFYGVASTPLGGGRIQERGPEAGLHERADQPSICAYYADVLTDRLLPSGRVETFLGCDYLGGRRFRSRISGEEFEVSPDSRVVDATYLSPGIPVEMPLPFAVGDGARVVPVNGLADLDEAPSQYVVVGSGKTATDACIWLLAHGVDPDAIRWVRPREPWMLNRAVVQPDPAVFLGMVADTLEAAAAARSLDDLFLRLEDAGIMLRLDRSDLPTMARTPTLGTWELDLLRTVENVVRLGHIRAVGRDGLDLDEGSVRLPRGALVVNCAGEGLRHPPLVPIWQPEAITLQPVRSGFPCFGAALIGYVEATRDEDAVKNELCRPSPYGNSLAEWARMTVLGLRNSRAFGSAPDVKTWCDNTTLDPARIAPGSTGSASLDDALGRVQASVSAGDAGLARLGGLALSTG